MKNIDVYKFPLNTFYLKISSDPTERDQIKTRVLDLINKTEEDGNGFIDKLDWVTGMDFNTRDWIKIFYPHLIKYLNAAATASGFEQVLVQTLWFQQYIKTNRHEWHTHSGQWVGVYYLEMPEGAPKTELIVPFNQNEKIVVDAKEGDFLLFPSHVIHRCPVIENDIRKTIISWNYDQMEILPATVEVLDKL